MKWPAWVAVALLAVAAIAFAVLWWYASGPAPHGGQRERIDTPDGKRSFVAWYPDAADHGPGPHPVLVALHPAYGFANQFERVTDLGQRGSEAGFVVVMPEGVGRMSRVLQTWNATHCCEPARSQADDVAFLDALLDHLAAGHRVGSGPVVLVGHSNGGMMAHAYAGQRPERVAALVAYAGSVGSGAGPDAIDHLPPPAAPVPVLLMHGQRDHTVPFDTGKGNDWWFLGHNETVAHWRAVNVPAAVAVEEVVIPEAGHAWSGGRPNPFGAKPAAFDATGAALAFAASYVSG